MPAQWVCHVVDSGQPLKSVPSCFPKNPSAFRATVRAVEQSGGNGDRDGDDSDAYTYSVVYDADGVREDNLPASAKCCF